MVRGWAVARRSLAPRLAWPTGRFSRIAAMGRAPTINPNGHEPVLSHVSSIARTSDLSVWGNMHVNNAQASNNRPTSADVAIIGAGPAGLNAAYLLTQQG